MWQDKGLSLRSFVALVVSFLAIGNEISRAYQQRGLNVAAPAECLNGYGAPQLLSAPAVLSDPLKTSSNQDYLQALQLYASGDKMGAEKYFRQAVEEWPANGQFVASLARLYVSDSQPNPALEVIRSYTKVCGVTALGYALEAEVLFQQRHYDDALGAIISSLKLYPKSARMHELLGLILLVRRDDSDASLELQKAEQIDPDNAEIHYYYGRILYLTGHDPEARDQFLACRKNDPNYRKALENLALTYEALYDTPNAARCYQQAIEREQTENVKHGEPFGFYGAMLIRLGRSNEALKVLQEGVAASPLSLVVNFELGRLLFDQHQLGQAQHFLKVAENLDPQYAQTHYLLGRIYIQENHGDEANQEIKKFRELDRDPANHEFPATDR